MNVRMVHVLCLGFLLLVFGGCLGRTPPPKLYVLMPLGDATAGGAEAASAELAIGVGPVTIPEYLNRPEIVTRVGCGTGELCGELRVSELDRWAEPLEGNVTRVLAENLSLLLGTERVERYPWRPSTPLDFQIRVDVMRLDVASGQIALTVRWSVVGKDGEVLRVKRSEYRDRAPSVEVEGHHGATVSALSRGLAQLSREIAEALTGLSRR